MKKEIVFIQLNDVHGYLNIHPELFYENGTVTYRKCGGYARIATVINHIRKQYPTALLMDSGDTFHGTFPVVNTKGEILPPLLNELQFSAMTAHWDFAYGPDHLTGLVNSLNYPLLAANVYEKENRKLVYPPFLVRETEDMVIGVTGLACNIVDKTMPPSFSEGVFFTDGSSELPGLIRQLKEQYKTELIVLLSHNGFPQDVELVKNNPGIDIVLSGHTHNRLYQPFMVNNTLIIQSGCHGSFLGFLKLSVDNGKVTAYKHELMEIAEEITPDALIQEKTDELLKPYEFLQDIVGETSTPLNRGFSLESSMDNFLLESIRSQVPADVYFSNGWRYGAPILAGKIRLEDLYNITPMDPVISTVNLTGSEIFSLIEENLEKTYSHEPLKQMGGYVKRVLGLNVFFKAENPAGTRIQSIFINNKPLQEEKIYPAAFITVQGVPEKYGTGRKNTGLHAVEAMKLFLKNNSPVNIRMQNSFVLV